MALDISGKIVQKMNKTEGISKAGKPWSKQEFVIETFDTYPRKVCLSVMNDKVNELERYNVGDTINASLNIESREYNGRWYTDVRAWKLNSAQATSGSNTSQNGPSETFQGGSESGLSYDGASDDLPF
jgi:hypothetical protein